MSASKKISTEDFLDSLRGNVVNTTTDGKDVYQEYEDGRVVIFTTYRGCIVLGQVNARPQTLQ